MKISQKTVYTVLIITASGTGCRLGNQVVNPPNPDPYTGYYETQPRTLAFCSMHPDNVNPTEICKSTTTDFIPTFVNAAMTNPLAFGALSQPTGTTHGTAALYPYNLNKDVALPVDFDTNFNLNFNGQTLPSTLFVNNDGCTIQLVLSEQGAVTRYPSVKTVTVAGLGLPTQGSVTLTTTVLYQLAGNCGQTLALMQSCYGDTTKCGASDPDPNLVTQENVDRHAYCVDMFQPYIDAQAMTSDDIPKVQYFGYEVSYQ